MLKNLDRRGWQLIVAGIFCLVLFCDLAQAQNRYGGYLLSIGYSDSILPENYVTLLQQDLYTLGYGESLASEGGITGSFSYGTYLAVRQFQQNHHLEVNGIVDFDTIQEIEQSLLTPGGNEPIETFPGLPRLQYIASFSAQLGEGSPQDFALATLAGNSYVIAIKGNVVPKILSPLGDEVACEKLSPVLASAIRDQIPPGYDQILYLDHAVMSADYKIKVEAEAGFLSTTAEIMSFQVNY